VIDAKVSSLFL